MKLYDIIIIILFIATLIIVFWYLLGNSPTLEQGLLLLIITLLFTAYGTLREMKGDLGSTKPRLNGLEKGFLKLAAEFKEHSKHKK